MPGTSVGGILAAALLFAGCPGSLESSEQFLVGCGPPDALFETCTSASCHSAERAASGLDLESPDLALRLTGTPATGCDGILVDPTAPETSVLYTKLTDAPPCGDRMPAGKDPLDAFTQGCVLEWIRTVGEE